MFDGIGETNTPDSFGDSTLSPDAAIFHEALASYEKVMADSWRRYLCQHLLGASLAAQKKTADAGPMLVSGFEGMLQRQSSMEAYEIPRLTAARNRVVQFYNQIGRPDKVASVSEVRVTNPPSSATDSQSR
jgi:hypothetical protein